MCDVHCYWAIRFAKCDRKFYDAITEGKRRNNKSRSFRYEPKIIKPRMFSLFCFRFGKFHPDHWKIVEDFEECTQFNHNTASVCCCCCCCYLDTKWIILQKCQSNAIWEWKTNSIRRISKEKIRAFPLNTNEVRKFHWHSDIFSATQFLHLVPYTFFVCVCEFELKINMLEMFQIERIGQFVTSNAIVSKMLCQLRILKWHHSKNHFVFPFCSLIANICI